MVTKKIVWLIVGLTSAAFIVFPLLSYYRSFKSRGMVPVRPHLRVFVYPGFIAPYGPGPKLKKTFENQCQCNLDFISSGSSELLVDRLKSVGADYADVVLGLDQGNLQIAQNDFKWAELPKLEKGWAPSVQDAVLTNFWPIDWSPMAFVYREGAITPPKSLKDLGLPEYKGKVSLPDPRVSTTGFQFLIWAQKYFPAKAEEFFVQASPAWHTIAASWSTSYGLFQAKQVPMTFSYLSSVAYHLLKDKDSSVKVAPIKEAPPSQVEFIGVLEGKRQALGIQFAEFLISAEAQKIIATSNFMFPVREGVELPEPYDSLLKQVPPTSFKLINSDDRSLFLKNWEKSREFKNP